MLRCRNLLIEPNTSQPEPHHLVRMEIQFYRRPRQGDATSWELSVTVRFLQCGGNHQNADDQPCSEHYLLASVAASR